MDIQTPISPSLPPEVASPQLQQKNNKKLVFWSIIGVVVIIIFAGVIFFFMNAANKHKSSQYAQTSTPRAATSSYAGIVIESGEKYFLVKNGNASEVQKSGFQLVKKVDQDSSSAFSLFTVDTKDKSLYVYDDATSKETAIGYQLKEQGDFYEALGGVLYSLNGKEAIIRIATIDRTIPESEFGGGPDPEKITEYRYNYTTNTLAPSSLFDTAYDVLGVDKTPSTFGPAVRFVAWDSDKNLLYGMNTRFGEGGDRALRSFSIVDTAKKTIIDSLKPETDKTIEIPTFFAIERKLVTVKVDDNAKQYTLNIYNIDKPQTPEKTVDLATLSGSNVAVSPISFTSDGQEMLIKSENRSAYIDKGFFVNLSTGKIDEIYTDDTVLGSFVLTSPGSEPILAPDDKTIFYEDYTNLHQQPIGPDRLKMKAEDDRYNLVSIDRASKQRQVLYEGRDYFSIIGFAKE